MFDPTYVFDEADKPPRSDARSERHTGGNAMPEERCGCYTPSIEAVRRPVVHDPPDLHVRLAEVEGLLEDLLKDYLREVGDRQQWMLVRRIRAALPPGWGEGKDK
jgi:hypothetical protein